MSYVIPHPSVGLIRPDLIEAAKRFMQGPQIIPSPKNYYYGKSWGPDPSHEFWKVADKNFKPEEWDNLDLIYPYIGELQALPQVNLNQFIAWSRLYMTWLDITDALHKPRRHQKPKSLRADRMYQTAKFRIEFWRDYMQMSEKQIVHLMIYASDFGGYTTSRDKKRSEEAMMLAFLDLYPHLLELPTWLTP